MGEVLFGKIPVEDECPKCGGKMESMSYEGSYICHKCKYQRHKIIIQRRD